MPDINEILLQLESFCMLRNFISTLNFIISDLAIIQVTYVQLLSLDETSIIIF